MKGTDKLIQEHPDWFELFKLYYKDGVWVATLYSELCNMFVDLRFMFYSKRGVIQRLRHEYGIKVGRQFC